MLRRRMFNLKVVNIILICVLVNSNINGIQPVNVNAENSSVSRPPVLQTVKTGQTIEPIKTVTIKTNKVIKYINKYNNNPYQDQWMNITATFYSENEKTDKKGCETQTALGQRLFDGVIAVPKQIPLYSLFLLEDGNGNKKVYIALDTGNTKCIRMLNDSSSKMIIDIYKPNASNKTLNDLGRQEIKCKILRWGKDKESSLQDDKNLIETLNDKLKNSEDINLFFKVPIVEEQNVECDTK